MELNSRFKQCSDVIVYAYPRLMGHQWGKFHIAKNMMHGTQLIIFPISALII